MRSSAFRVGSPSANGRGTNPEEIWHTNGTKAIERNGFEENKEVNDVPRFAFGARLPVNLHTDLIHR
jgi:hypothetical protein